MAKSQFGKALGRELGKNTGRVISNGLFGDKHASKHSHIVRMGRLEAQKAKAEAGLEIEEKRIKQEADAFESAQIDNISNLNLSTNEAELANQLNQIISLISGQKSRRIKKSGIEKIDFGITQLKSPEQKQYFEKKLKSIKFKFNLVYYLAAVAFVLVLIGFLMTMIDIIAFQNIGGLFVIIGGAGLIIILFRGLIKLQDN